MDTLNIAVVAEVNPNGVGRFMSFLVDTDAYDGLKNDHPQSAHVLKGNKMRVVWLMFGDHRDPAPLMSLAEEVLTRYLPNILISTPMPLVALVTMLEAWTRPRNIANAHLN